jgi:hypothetical protein
VINKETLIIPGEKVDEMEMEEPKQDHEEEIKGD